MSSCIYEYHYMRFMGITSSFQTHLLIRVQNKHWKKTDALFSHRIANSSSPELLFTSNLHTSHYSFTRNKYWNSFIFAVFNPSVLNSNLVPTKLSNSIACFFKIPKPLRYSREKSKTPSCTNRGEIYVLLSLSVESPALFK